MGGLKDREKMTRLLFGGVSDNDAKKGTVAVEALSCGSAVLLLHGESLELRHHEAKAGRV